MLDLPLPLQGGGDPQTATGLPPLLPPPLRRHLAPPQPVLPDLPHVAAPDAVSNAGGDAFADAAFGVCAAVALSGGAEEQVMVMVSLCIKPGYLCCSLWFELVAMHRELDCAFPLKVWFGI